MDHTAGQDAEGLFQLGRCLTDRLLEGRFTGRPRRCYCLGGQIVEALENGELPLEDSLRLFEEGVMLARASQAKLDGAEKRVEELLSVDESGNPLVREIDLE